MTENKPYIEAMRQLRRSSAAQPQADRRTRKSRTRQSAKRRAITTGW